ncbi:MAG: hypothetical protein OXM02_07465 [Bacteroidota bacterium]|nr:hypothetical protein [Bacteroidota bacterium]MDE2834345.1 hypothetical protein [Bacteroidota bacterium]MDE2957157.1 hypothetical protein [Bacteroidota bacterium]
MVDKKDFTVQALEIDSAHIENANLLAQVTGAPVSELFNHCLEVGLDRVRFAITVAAWLELSTNPSPGGRATVSEMHHAFLSYAVSKGYDDARSIPFLEFAALLERICKAMDHLGWSMDDMSVVGLQIKSGVASKKPATPSNTSESEDGWEDDVPLMVRWDRTARDLGVA